MDISLLQQLKNKQIDSTLRTKEYKELLKQISKNIFEKSLTAETEATIASIFEINLYEILNSVFNLKYYPQKEVPISTERHIKKGRIDSKIGALIIEFKHPSKLSTNKDKEIASNQLKNYLNGLNQQKYSDYYGIITDGLKCKFIYNQNNSIIEGPFEKISDKHLDQIIKIIILLDRIALTPDNLIKDFCEGENNISKQLSISLFKALKNKPAEKSLMLFNEWKELFKLAHDDVSKQQAIKDRKQALKLIVNNDLENKDDEYIALYAIQTTYAIIVKIIAYKICSKIGFKKELIEFNKYANSSSEEIRTLLESLENGALFRDFGLNNLLEGDFFSWYCTNNQWNSEIWNVCKEIFSKLTQYENKNIILNEDNIQDLFKDLFMKIIPDKVRHSLGEYYTPSWLADNLISEAIDILPVKTKWTAIDPCAGSGTFITVLIKRVLNETVNLSNKERLNEILNRVKAIDLNPLAVLTARINYFINIAHLITDDIEFEIPVYLGDASYVPSIIKIDNIECFKYTIQTIKGDINIVIPKSACKNNLLFSKTMTSIEEDIKNSDSEAIVNKFKDLIPLEDLTPPIKLGLNSLAKKFIELENNKWNGIWARIVTNFITTANLGKFDLIIGNPPWIDWKNLPIGYRERLKNICIEKHLFSGDRITGGINLNICALISNVASSNWLKDTGVLAFLMPNTILFQQTYEGFRHFRIGKSRLYFNKLIDWAKAGNPFNPVQQKFLSYFFTYKEKNYEEGIPIIKYIKKRGKNLEQYQKSNFFSEVKDIFEIKNGYAGQIYSEKTSAFTCVNDRTELINLKKIVGDSYYKGREGIEFYPQEVFILNVDKDIQGHKDSIIVKNIQKNKSKYKIAEETFLLEKKYLQPLIKGIDIKRFHLNNSNYIVPFPYKNGDRSPISIKNLNKESPLLAKYLNKHKDVIEKQTNYNKKIIGNKYDTEFYSLARIGIYSFAKYYVAFRDNSKWGACVIGEIETPWGELKRPQFQNHAVSISQTKDGRFISFEEAHYICAILNSRIVTNYIYNSSDSRSFKIDPPIYIPPFNSQNIIHNKLSNLSILAHKNYSNKEKMELIDNDIDRLVIMLKE